MIDLLLSAWETLSPLPRAHRPAVLSLHQVADAGWLRGLGEALRRRWIPIPLAEFVERHAAGTLLGGHLAVTFDDGFRSVRTMAAPVLGGLGIPFTTFVCTEVLGGGPAPWFYRAEHLLNAHAAPALAPYWGLPASGVSSGFELLNALKEAPFGRVLDGLGKAETELGVDPEALRGEFLSEEDLAALAGDPWVTVGSHTRRHPILASLSASDQQAEIEGSARAIAEVTGSRPRFFAYPNGKPEDFDAVTVGLLRSAGFEAALTTVQRPVASGEDPFRLPRVGVSQGDSMTKLRMKRALPLPSRGDLQEARTRSRFASARGDTR